MLLNGLHVLSSVPSVSCLLCFKRAGVLLGIAIRTGSPLSLNLAEPVWKQLAGMSVTIADLSEVTRGRRDVTPCVPSTERGGSPGVCLRGTGCPEAPTYSQAVRLLPAGRRLVAEPECGHKASPLPELEAPAACGLCRLYRLVR